MFANIGKSSNSDMTESHLRRPRPPRPLPICARLCVAFLFFIIIISTIGAVLLPIYFSAMISKVIAELLVINPSSQLYEGWKDPSMPLYQSYYFFDVQNTEGILRGEKPRVVEKGPYTYFVNVTRHNITFSADNETVYYEQLMTYSFDQERSNGTEDDLVTTVNIPFVASAAGTKYRSFWERLAMTAVGNLNRQEVFTTISIRDLLWGAKHDLLSHLQNLAGKDMIETDFFGLLVGKNATNPVRLTVNTGKSNSSHISEVIEANGMTSLPWWGSNQTNMINGTDGSMYGPNIQKNDTLHLFSPLNFRSTPFIYQHDWNYRGLPLYHFYVPRSAYANPEEYPPNAGYCLSDAVECAPTGVLNISSCSQGAPMALSLPHFLYGDDQLINSTDGIEPNETLHQSSLDVEPNMGFPMQVTQRHQLNIYLEEIGGVQQTHGLRSLYFPVMWVEAHGVVPDSIVKTYVDGMKMAQNINFGFRYGCIGLGVLCLILAVIIFFYYSHKSYVRKQNEQRRLKDMKKTAVKNEYIALPQKERTEIIQNGCTNV